MRLPKFGTIPVAKSEKFTLSACLGKFRFQLAKPLPLGTVQDGSEVIGPDITESPLRIHKEVTGIAVTVVFHNDIGIAPFHPAA